MLERMRELGCLVVEFGAPIFTVLCHTTDCGVSAVVEL